MDSKVFIVLVNYESYNDTIECIDSLSHLYHKNTEIIVVDNNSRNDSVEIISSKCSNIILLKSGRNLGWSGGNNLGIQYALKNGAEYVLLLNNDTVVENNFINEMLACFTSHKDAGVVGCKIKYYDNRNLIWFAGGRVNWHKYLAENIGNKEYDCDKYNIEQESDYITGCAMLIKSDVFNKVGLLPEEYFMYYEDVDFSVNVKEKGYRLIYCPKSVIYHKVSSSTGGEDSPFTIKWMTRNRMIFFKKYKFKSMYNQFLSFIHIILSQIKNITQYIIKLDFKRVSAILQGLLSGLSY